MGEKTEQELHPTVTSFKAFINKNPILRKEIRRSGRSWQEYYEKWVLLGEDDPYWNRFKEKEENSQTQSNSGKKEEKSEQKNVEIMNQLMKLGENIDFNKIQGQVANLSKTIGVVQELMDQFQQSKNQQQTPKAKEFNWFQD